MLTAVESKKVELKPLKQLTEFDNFAEDLSKLAHWYGPSRAVISRKAKWRRELTHLLPTQTEDTKTNYSEQIVDKWHLYPIHDIKLQKLPLRKKLTGKGCKKERRTLMNIHKGMKTKAAFEANCELRKKSKGVKKKRKLSQMQATQ